MAPVIRFALSIQRPPFPVYHTHAGFSPKNSQPHTLFQMDGIDTYTHLSWHARIHTEIERKQRIMHFRGIIFDVRFRPTDIIVLCVTFLQSLQGRLPATSTRKHFHGLSYHGFVSFHCWSPLSRTFCISVVCAFCNPSTLQNTTSFHNLVR